MSTVDSVLTDLFPNGGFASPRPAGFEPPGEAWPGFESIEMWRDLLLDREAGVDAEPPAITADPFSIEPVGNFAVGLLRCGGIEALAWHDPGFIVVDLAGADHLMVKYAPSSEAKQRMREARNLRNGWWPANRIQTWFEWHLVLGSNTTHAHLESKSRFRRGSVALHGAGYAIGTVIRFAGRPRKLTSDPSHKRRLRHWTEQNASYEHSIPDIANATATSSRDRHSSIFIHGTISCGIKHAPYVEPLLHGQRFRYEHDTFLPIRENSVQLADYIRRATSIREPGTSVTLVAHSRGGLVARDAAALIGKDDPALRERIQLVTLGTPHTGTPFARAGAAGIRGLVWAVGVGAGAIGAVDPATAALKYLVGKRVQRPRGIAAMEPNSDFLNGLNLARQDDSADCVAIAGVYDTGADPSGVGPGLRTGFGRSLFEGAANDLVVSESSATAWGTAMIAEGACAHSDYLLNRSVRDFLKYKRLLSSQQSTADALRAFRKSRRLTQQELSTELKK